MADTFDKLKSSLNRGITAISVKTSSSLEKSKLKTDIDSLKAEIQKLYCQIGETAYGKWLSADPDCSALEQLFEEVRSRQKTISELSETLNSIDERDSQILGAKTEKPAAPAVTCPGCGASYDSPVKFCRSCGCKMPE